MPMAHTPTEIFDRTLDLLERLIHISSPSGDAAGLRQVAELYAGELASRGLATEIRQQAGAGGEPLPVVYARGAAARKSYRMLIGHLDTVLPAQPAERRGGRLWGTGAVDMKGGLAVFAGALDLLAHQGRPAPRDLLMAVVPDEEVAGVLSTRKSALVALRVWPAAR